MAQLVLPALKALSVLPAQLVQWALPVAWVQQVHRVQSGPLESRVQLAMRALRARRVLWGLPELTERL